MGNMKIFDESRQISIKKELLKQKLKRFFIKTVSKIHQYQTILSYRHSLDIV